MNQIIVSIILISLTIPVPISGTKKKIVATQECPANKLHNPYKIYKFPSIKFFRFSEFFDIDLYAEKLELPLELEELLARVSWKKQESVMEELKKYTSRAPEILQIKRLKKQLALFYIQLSRADYD